MDTFKIGEIVTRKSYGGDIYFRITNITDKGNGERIYTLKGLFHRLEADSHMSDLIKQNPVDARYNITRGFFKAKRYAQARNQQFIPKMFRRMRGIPGKVLHIDADGEFMQTCLKYYREANITAMGKTLDESEQPYYVRQLLSQYQPDILVVTGHDGIKKNTGDIHSIGNYKNSNYYMQSAKEARIYEPDPDKLCIFSGACQSYYEAIIDAGANFASSPGRVLINALDPAIVAEKVALTDQRNVVTARQIAGITYSGSKGIGGIRTKGHFKVEA
jgi:spore coat assemly protein